MTRIAFFGTPSSAVPTLAELAQRFDVGLVITQPDRPRGRSGKPAPSAVKMHAIEAGLRVAQPETGVEIPGSLESAGPVDLGVVVAYGRILKPEVLEMPGHGLLNVHFSLLPRWRGAAPVARALIEGDDMSGVTIIRLDEGLDTGPVLTAQAVDILSHEDAGSLTERLSGLGARLVASVIPGYLAGDIEPVPQVDEGATHAAKITAEDRVLGVEASATEFVNRVRGLAPVPGASLVIDGKRHKILAARPHRHVPGSGSWEVEEGVPVVAVGGEGVEIVSLQPPGKTAQAGADWVRGRRQAGGEVS